MVNWKVANRPIPIDINTVVLSPRSTNQVLTGTRTSTTPIRIRIKDVGIPRGSIVSQKVRNANPFKKSITQFSPEDGPPTPVFSKVINRKTVAEKSANVNSLCGMYFRRNTVVAKIPNFVDFRLSPTNIPDKLKSFIFPATRVRSLTNGSDWLLPRHDID